MLVSPAEVCAYRGVDDVGQDEVLLPIIEAVEAHFLALTNRRHRPFQPAQANRLEVHHGTGISQLFLHYPVEALTSITLGYASPWDETLTVADPTVLQFEVGSRRLDRVDGGTFGELEKPRYVRVTYDAQADEPADVKLAVIRVVDALWRESGSAEATAERTLPDGENLPLVADQDPIWRAAVDTYWEPAG